MSIFSNPPCQWYRLRPNTKRVLKFKPDGQRREPVKLQAKEFAKTLAKNLAKELPPPSKTVVYPPKDQSNNEVYD